ncbi:hypothetical protein KY290_019917 [Solanum tuberosum]|uniref:GAG-pre-integrase domain-containing protein n=1 Tax=Solanum tuberosum TaxID=4113 RepID=A0ABQ7VIE4_SOLTU|nr:hypothetical protein KY290_019917 [Solanum tuberosum]
MKKLWEEVNTIDVSSYCTCVCTCGGKTKLHKDEHNRRLIHLLMGLNEMYTTIRGNILMMSTLPSMAQAFVILSQEENQGEMKPHNNTVLDSTSLNAYGQFNNGTSFKNPRTIYSSTKEGRNGPGNFNNTAFRDQDTQRAYVYKLHGYPSNSRFPKGKGSGFAGNICASEMNEGQSEGDHELKRQIPLNLFKDQYEQLLNLLGTLQVGNGGTNSDNSNNMMNGAVNLAVKVTEIGDVSLSPMLTLNKGPSSLKSPLELGRAKNGLYFLCPKCHNCCPSSAEINSSLVKCHLVPSLVNVDKDFNRNNCSVKDSDSINKNGYSTISSLVCPNDNCSSFAITSNHTHDDELLWHTRLGHVPFVKMKNISTIPVTFSPKQPFNCTIFPVARQTRLPFPESTTATKVYMDTFAQMQE